MNFSHLLHRHVGSAGFPACGLRGLSSPQLEINEKDTELESSVNPQTRMSALRAKGLPSFQFQKV